MARVNVIMYQRYNEVKMSFPNAMMAGLFMDDAIVATDGNVEFKVSVEMDKREDGVCDVTETDANTDED